MKIYNESNLKKIFNFLSRYGQRTFENNIPNLNPQETIDCDALISMLRIHVPISLQSAMADNDAAEFAKLLSDKDVYVNMDVHPNDNAVSDHDEVNLIKHRGFLLIETNVEPSKQMNVHNTFDCLQEPSLEETLYKIGLRIFSSSSFKTSDTKEIHSNCSKFIQAGFFSKDSSLNARSFWKGSKTIPFALCKVGFSFRSIDTTFYNIDF